jgi:hypothetical protein
VSHPLRAGSLESLLLESARNDLRVLDRLLRETEGELEELRAKSKAEVDGLRARMAAMEESRFWKMRNAWFGLKRTLHLTDEE